MPETESLVSVEAVVKGTPSGVKFHTCLINKQLGYTSTHLLSKDELTDKTYMEKLFLDEVIYLEPLGDSWATDMLQYLRRRLKKVTVLVYTSKLGKQPDGSWLFGSKAQFYPNGSPVPVDMIQYYTPSSKIEPVELGSENHLRTFLGDLMEVFGGSLDPILIFTTFVLYFHNDLADTMRLAAGCHQRPFFKTTKPATLSVKAISTVTSLNKEDILVVDEGDFHLSNDEGSDFEMNLPFEATLNRSGSTTSFIKNWLSAPHASYQCLPHLIKLGRAMSTESFDAKCRSWIDLVLKQDIDLKVNYGILLAVMDLVGDLHGDWDRLTVQEYASKLLGGEFRSPAKRPAPEIESVSPISKITRLDTSNISTDLELPPIDGLGGLIFPRSDLQTISPNTNPMDVTDKSLIEGLINSPLTTENQQKIINAIISFFLDQVPTNRDPKDFIRSSYRTRDSTEVYVALRLPILRRLLDAETRKIFRDILDNCGGQRQQTRFGSDSTSAQLIPRDLCSRQNLDRIDLMIRNRLEQRKLMQSSRPLLPVHSGLSLLPESFSHLDGSLPHKQLRMSDILDGPMLHEGICFPADEMIKIEDTD